MGLVCLLKNLSFLCKKPLYQELAYLKNEVVNNTIEETLYEAADSTLKVQAPRIFSMDETIEKLADPKVSLARFGDGEFSIMDGGFAVGQEQNQLLRKRLWEVFSAPEPEMLIGVPRVLWYSKVDLEESVKKFWRRYGAGYRKKLNKYMIRDKQYCATEISQNYIWYPQMDHQKFFRNFRSLWQERELVVVSVYDFRNSLKFNIFDNARHVDYFIPEDCGGNAFSHYDEILKKCLTFPKDRLFIFILGATSKVLAYDLFHQGYQAWDLGHVAKSYDWFCQNKPVCEKEFFVQDK